MICKGCAWEGVCDLDVPPDCVCVSRAEGGAVCAACSAATSESLCSSCHGELMGQPLNWEEK